MKTRFITIFLVLVFIGGCIFQQPDYLNVLSPSELNDIMQDQDVFLVDVHTPQQRHIKGTDLVIPYDRIEENRDRLPADKSTPIYLYCKGGPMANAAARTLHDLGYKNLYNLKGGADAWREAGLPFE